MAWLHGWAGLVIGWLLLAICASGTASVFKGEIGDWMRPEISATAKPVDAVAAALRYLSTAAPKSPAWYLTAPDHRTSATIALYQDPEHPERAYRYVALDPVTGRPDGIRDTLGGEFLYRFHFELQLPYPWGRILASIAAMTLLVTLITGIITHRRIFADFFTLRPGKGKRSWLDLHNVLGVFALPFHLMIALTGVVTLVSLTLPWPGLSRYGTDNARMYAGLTPGFVTRPATGRASPPGNVLAMLHDAERRFGGGHIGMVSVDNPGDAGALLRVVRHDRDQLGYNAATATYDMASGRLVAFYAEARPGRTTYDVLYGLHLGRFALPLTHWLYFLSGLMLTATIATGLILWSRGREGSRHFGDRLVERLTVGSVVGMPLAIATFFWANRLVGVSHPFRQQIEVRAFFVVLAATLITGLLMRPKRGWILGLFVASAAWLGLPIVSAMTVGRGMFGGTSSDHLFIAFDLTSLSLGTMLGFGALAVLRHKPRIKRRSVC
jgi:uncharacterized iron-regulated membrane protein